ncbi:hypothetical protein F5X98DRAFT_391160 [Xylaria grammica]|nr:hypothetical protein F5X98DRAFT_391160 [Xylaria grammica]
MTAESLELEAINPREYVTYLALAVEYLRAKVESEEELRPWTKFKSRHPGQHGCVLNSNPKTSSELMLLQAVSALLNGVQSPATEDVRTLEHDDACSDNEPKHSIDTKSSPRLLPFADGASASAVKSPAASGWPPEDIFNKLRNRRALPDTLTKDDKTEALKLIFDLHKFLKIPPRNMFVLKCIILAFLQLTSEPNPGVDLRAIIEDLCNDINDWKSTVRLPTITDLDFRKDMMRANQYSNEDAFRRTAMISILDRWRLDTMFDFNCEGGWSLQGSSYPLPSTQGPEDNITGPEPDIAIFFKTDAMCQSGKHPITIPIKMIPCIFPDGYGRRCFPFVFIEAKGFFEDITPALHANMHSASQALFNIYVWMKRAGQTDTFFRHVRLFSISMNASVIIVRTHRARALETGDGLEFLCDHLGTFWRFDRVYLVIHTILAEYGAKELCEILKSTYQGVSKQLPSY